MPQFLETKNYTIAWLCPLYFEAGAALAMLDEYHGVPRRSPGQTVQYHGRIGQHNVVIVGFPGGEVGIGAAASVATEVTRDFPHLEAGMLIGIAAGIPSPANDIRLGDVVVAVPTGDSSGVIGYDLVNIEPELIRLKQWQDATHPALRSAISDLRACSMLPRGLAGETLPQGKFWTYIERLGKTPFQPPSTPPPTSFSPTDTRPSGECPVVHYGCILSGNSVVKSAALRDEMAKARKPIAIEMEAAGVMNRLPVAVIRGVSDFANADKNDDWQFYAAATAAAYAKELLFHLSPLRAENAVPSQPSAPQVRTRMSQAALNHQLDEKVVSMNRRLDWRNSVVDLLKVLDLDWSPEARVRLAKRWHVFVGEDGSVARNIALHGVVIDEIAKNDGRASKRLVAALSLTGDFD
ncbi:nucleoside phosphorylase domain-containing protein [Aspergillus karnatakaensis]|uniref:nucleoside phosphorylase domain-containing protein n=1 Tax=Aspergillus karnatakaensis TaxID=1810916 RepID=UPI003CCE15A4